ncbi:MAG: hypothetical protein ABI831_01170 [Betaproteobacteria bacterium]
MTDDNPNDAHPGGNEVVPLEFARLTSGSTRHAAGSSAKLGYALNLMAN